MTNPTNSKQRPPSLRNKTFKKSNKTNKIQCQNSLSSKDWNYLTLPPIPPLPTVSFAARNLPPPLPLQNNSPIATCVGTHFANSTLLKQDPMSTTREYYTLFAKNASGHSFQSRFLMNLTIKKSNMSRKSPK